MYEMIIKNLLRTIDLDKILKNPAVSEGLASVKSIADDFERIKRQNDELILRLTSLENQMGVAIPTPPAENDGAPA